MTVVHYIAKVQNARLIELPEEAAELGLTHGDEIEVSVSAGLAQTVSKGRDVATTPQERATAFRAWADSHPHNTPLLSDEAISRESIYCERG